MDIQKITSIHFVGIRGVAMTALAIYCKERGIHVTGSDVEGSFPTEESLVKADIDVFLGFSPEHISKVKPDLIIYTGAHKGVENPEVMYAKELNIPVLPHGKALGMIVSEFEQIAVAGSHGKTTTSAMIATILMSSSQDPSYTVGSGNIRGLGLPGHFGKGKVFVTEADEYITDPGHDTTPRFLWLHPDILVVTNIDFDHPDAYKDIASVQEAFVLLTNQMKGRKTVIVNRDDEKSAVLLAKNENTVITYGCSPTAEYHVSHIRNDEDTTYFSITLRGMEIGEFAIQVPGKHNVLDATAAIVACREYGVSFDDIQKGLRIFGGAKRRLECVASTGQTLVFDDYAHHPHEIAASLDAIRFRYPEKHIISVFQPHTYSRTKMLLREFGMSFSKSDVVLIADIYASAREVDTLGISSKTVVEEIAKHHSNVLYIKDLDGAVQYIKNHETNNDIILCMGAGDIYEWAMKIASVVH